MSTENKQAKSIAFWDFDETITTTDSLWHFLLYTQSWSKLFFAAMRYAHVLAGMALGLVSNMEAKIAVLGYFFGGWESHKFHLLCRGFATEKIPRMLNPQAMQKLKWHKEQGHELVLVSASLEGYLLPWCQSMNMACLATKLKEENGRIVATYHHPNCYGAEKAKRIKEAYNLHEYDCVYAYGNSEKGDRHMLNLANKPFFRKFD